nr:hemagglutinin repeat-containing protein [Bordetella sp. FB-8]
MPARAALKRVHKSNLARKKFRDQSVEVAGPKADVVVSNSSGIVVDGGGFINTARGVLTTGTPVLDANGNLTGLNVTGGNITVQGGGLDASNMDEADLISRAVQVNAAIHGKAVSVVAGANQVDYPSQKATSITGTGAAPTVAIDVKQLGGMYANRITLVGTENGVGVSNAGALVAQAGDLTLTASGRLVQSGQMVATGNIALSAHDGITNTGATYAQHDLVATTAGDLTNSGTLAARHNLSATVDSAVSTGTLGAGVNRDGSLAPSGDLTVAAIGTLAATGQNVAGGNASLSGAQVNLAGSQTSANSNLALSASSGDLNLAAAKTVAGGSLSASAQGALINDHGSLSSTGVQTVIAGSLSNQGGQMVSQATFSAQVTGALTNTGGTIQSAGALASTSASLDNTAGHITSLNTEGLKLTTGGLLNNGQGGTIGGNGEVTIAASHLSNAGTISAAQHLGVTTSGDIDNTGSMIGNTATLTAANVNNTGAAALIAGISSVGVYAANTLTNADGATIYSGGNIELARDSARDASGLLADQTGTITNSAATIEAAGNLDIAAHTLNNQRTGVQIDPGTPMTTTGSTLSLWTADLNWGQLGYYQSDFYPQWRFSAGAIGIDAASRLSTPITLTLPASQVTNINTANRTFSLTSPLTDQTTHTFTPMGDAGNTPPPVVTTRPITQSSTQYYQGLTNNGNGTVTIAFWPDYNPTVNIEPDQVRGRSDLGSDGHDYVEINRTPSITTTTERVLNAGTAALIQAQGALSVNADGGAINNDSSTMAAGGNLLRRAVGGSVNDLGTVLHQTRTETDTSTFYWHAKTSDDEDWRSVADATVPLSNTVVDSLPAVATSNQSVQVNAGAIHIGSTSTSAQPGTGAVQTLAGAIPGLTLPSNALYSYHAAPDSGPLIETDPRFTSYTKFISSDYLLGQLGVNPQIMPKRLGDGAYEEQLVMSQVTQLTGKTFLGSYTDNLDEYTALMQSGAQVARQFGLTVGVGLTAAQMFKLTSNMVWLVNQTVTLPDGTQQTVLVPKLYLAQSDTVNLKASGALVAGNTVNLSATGDLVNSGTVAGSTATTVAANNVLNQGTIGTGGTTTVAAAQNVVNLGGTIGGTDTQVTAGNDIVNQSTVMQAGVDTGNGKVYSNATGMATQSVGLISATHNVTLAAGRDVNLDGAAVQSGADASITAGRNLNASTLALTATQDAGTTDGLNGGHTQTTTNVGSTIAAGGNLTTVSGGDTTLADAAVQAHGDASLQAGGDLTVTAAKDTSTYNGQSMGGSLFHRKDSTYDETVQGSAINAGGNVTLAAGQGGTGNLSILGSTVTTGGAGGTAGGAVNLHSTGDIAVGTVAEEHDAQHWSHTSESGFLSQEQITTATTSKQSLAVGSTVFGNTLGANAGGDLSITGSTVGATNNVALAAQGNVGIEAATNTWDQTSYAEDNASGLMNSGGVGFTIGTRKQSEDDHSAGTTALASTVGSVNGNVDITSGNQYRQVGSNVTASTGDIAIQGKEVDIVEARQSSVGSQETKFEQTGLTLALSSPVISALQTVSQMAQAASQTSDTRAKALAAGASALTLYNTANSFNSPSGSGGSGGASGGGGQFSIALTVGHSHSDQISTQASNTGVGSNVAARGNVSIVATGAGQESNVTVRGSDVNAGGNALLQADNQVNLLASQDTSSARSQNFSSSAAVGVAVTMGSNGPAIGVTASGSLGKGHTNSDQVSNINSQVMAANTLTIKSGGDTTLKGAVAGGKEVVADVGGNLNLQSLQDTSTYDSAQMNVSGSVTVGYGASASLSFSNSNASGDYASVNGQTGIKAGDGGFQIGVQGNTDLKGAMIASSQAAVDQGKNSLTTGTLTTSDIANHSNYQASGFSLSGGYSVSGGGGQKALPLQSFKTGSQGAAAGFSSESGSQSSTTRSGISGGAVTITNAAAQQAATGQTAGQTVASLNRNVTSTSESDGLTKTWDGQQLQQEVAANAQITAVFGQQASKAVGDYAQIQLTKANALREQAKQDPAHAAELNAQADTLEAQWREGGAYRVAAHTAIGALTGGVEGALGSGLAAAAAPQLNALTANLPEGVKEAVGVAAAAGLGALTGDAGGIAAAINEDTNNRELHANEMQVIKNLSKGDPKEEGLLVAAACAMVHCADSVPESDPSYAYLKGMQDMGATLTNEQTLLLKSGGPGLFTYSWSNTTQDALSRYQVANRGIGLVQATLAGAGLVASDAVCATGVGCAATLASATTLTDYGVTGLMQAANGNTATPLGAQVLQSLGMSAEAAQILYGSLGIVASAVPSAVESSASSVVSNTTGATTNNAEVIATQINNFYRDGASPELLTQAYNQAAISSTQNASSSEVILGPYIEGSANSYDAVAQEQGATYFSMSDWGTVKSQLGAKNMWNINQAFLDQQIAQNKSFAFTVDPTTVRSESYTEMEYQYLQSKEYSFERGARGLYYAVKK